jgi:hypothetical protein
MNRPNILDPIVPEVVTASAGGEEQRQQRNGSVHPRCMRLLTFAFHHLLPAPL